MAPVQKEISNSSPGSAKPFSSLSSLPQDLCSYLIQAACSTVLPTWRQVSELHIKQVHQLNHGRHGVRDVTSIQVVSGVLCKLSGNIGSHLS